MSEIVITKADRASVLLLHEILDELQGEVFEEKDSIIHTSLCPLCL